MQHSILITQRPRQGLVPTGLDHQHAHLHSMALLHF